MKFASLTLAAIAVLFLAQTSAVAALWSALPMFLYLLVPIAIIGTLQNREIMKATGKTKSVSSEHPVIVDIRSYSPKRDNNWAREDNKEAAAAA